MKKFILSLLIVTSANLSAQDTGGAILGGVIGGIIGHQFGSGSGNTAATITGAVIGTMIGSEDDGYVEGYDSTQGIYEEPHIVYVNPVPIQYVNPYYIRPVQYVNTYYVPTNYRYINNHHGRRHHHKHRY